uniref:Uncharacterized protein n=1 Tax=Arundo donax TaxID=35708 RepID=A0A0A9SUE5_ARUDO
MVSVLASHSHTNKQYQSSASFASQTSYHTLHGPRHQLHGFLLSYV